MSRLTWPHVVLILGALTVVGALAWKGVDTAALIGLVAALVGGLTLGQVSQVRDQTNGQHSALVELVREQSRQLSRTYPAGQPQGQGDDTPAPEPPASPPLV